MTKEEHIKTIVKSIADEVRNKEFLTYSEIDDWEQYLTIVINIIIEKENKQLKDNWNKLKEITKSQSDFKLRCHDESLWFEVDELLNKMEEIEKGVNDD